MQQCINIEEDAEIIYGDLNNDGLMDLLPKDGWHYTAQSHDPPKVKGDYATFRIFMNDAEKLIQTTASGMYHTYSEQDLSSTITTFYKGDFSNKMSSIEKFSRRKLTKSLANLIQSL